MNKMLILICVVKKMNDVKIREMKDSDTLIRFAFNYVGRHVAAAIAGFFSAAATYEGLAPFGVSFVSCIFPEYIPAAVMGAAMGYLHIFGMTVLTLRYISAALVGAILSYILKKNLKRQLHRYFSLIASFFPLFATGILISFSITLSADEFFLYGAEAVFGAFFAWFLDKFLLINPSKRCIVRLSGTETAAVLVVFGIALMSLKNFDFYVFSPAVMVGVYAVLTAASFGGDKFGALSGIVAGVVLGLGNPNTFLTGGIALGGLLAGISGRQNRLINTLIFAVTVSVTAFSAEDWLTASYVFYSVGIGAVAFVLTPKKITKIFRDFFAFSDDGSFLYGQRNVLRCRLKTAADSMMDVTSSVKAVAGIYRRRSSPKEDDIYENVCNNLCVNCDGYDYCWNKNYEYTRSWIVQIAETLRYCNEPAGKELPQRFLNTCLAPEKIMKYISFEVERYRNAMRESAKTGETVNIVADQFGSVSDFLNSFSETMDSEEDYDAEKTAMVSDVLINDLGIELAGCGVFKNSDNKIFCEISFSSDQKINKKQLAEVISEVLGIYTEKGIYRKLSDGTATFTLCEKTKYAVETGGCQISSDGGKWCGDTFDTFFDGKGKLYMILSDGMGTGKKAAADSVMCCSLAVTLLKAGYPLNSILRMINSAMLVRSGEESLATLDIAVFNLYNGDVEFYKAGAAQSIAMRHMKLLKIEKPSLPVGILGNVKFEKAEMNLRDGDSFILMSDGVSENAVSMWREILKDATDYKGKELADKLAKTAHMNAENDNPDDITVVTAAIRIND